MRDPTGLRSRPACRFRRAFAASVSSASLLLGGCAAAPSPLTEAEKSALFEPACRGQSVAGAPAYPGAGAPHRIALVDPLPEFTLPGEWQAKSVADTQLVGCAKLSHTVIGSCQYINKGSVERWQYTISIDVRAAATGERVASNEILSFPPPCPSTISSNRSHLGSPSYDKLEAWLAPIVTGSAQP